MYGVVMKQKIKIHLISWMNLCKTIQFGGVGLRQPQMMNMALLAKLCWRLLQEPDNIWSQLIIAKYGRGRSDLRIFQGKQNSLERNCLELGTTNAGFEMDCRKQTKGQLLEGYMERYKTIG